MSTGIERPEFLPPPEPGLLRSVGLAVLAHVVLVLALSWGVRWKQDDNRIAVEAELWSATVQQAAPKPVEAPPPPPPPAPPKVEQPAPEPEPTVAQREAEIALEREKQREAEEKARQEEQERERVAAERKRQEEARKQELARKAAEEKKQREEQARLKRQQEQEQQQRLAKLREDNLKRMQSMANATGAPTDTGTAQRASGPSNSYAGRIRARVKPNIVFTDDVPGNPTAVVEVRLAPDGTIVGKHLRTPSGIKSWDDAVLRALDRTAVLPRDVDGSVPSSMVLVFRPRDL